jgi:uncharacterized RDD family membrane protein YckC
MRVADLVGQRNRLERSDAGADPSANGLLHEEYTIDTPENVTFGYAVAGIGSRFIGALIDSVLIVLLLLLTNFLLFGAIALTDGLPLGMADWAEGVLIALYALLNFAIIWGYYLVFELVWRGQTPGKRGAGTRVIAVGGGPATFLEVAIRNLVRIVDFMPFGYAVGLVTMLLNRQARRLGDFAAGTLVVKHRGEIKLETLGQAAPGTTAPLTLPAAAPDDLPRFPMLRRLRGSDYELICATLARYDAGMANATLLRRLAVAVAARLQTAPPVVYDSVINRNFLAAVVAAYRAQGEKDETE